MVKRMNSIRAVLLVALALSLVAATPVAAEEFVFATPSGAETTALKGSHDSEHDVFTTAIGAVKCSEVTYTGTLSGHEASSLEVAPTYSECFTEFGELSAEVEMNGCKYRLNAGTLEGGSGTGTLDVVCPEGKEVDIAVSGACTVLIPPQTELGPVAFTNIDKGNESEVTVEVAIESGISYSHSGFGCGSGSGEDGGYSGAALAQGEVEEEPTALVAMAAPEHGRVDSGRDLEIHGANGLTSAWLWFANEGKYIINEQVLFIGMKYKLATKSKEDGPECATTVVVPPARGCLVQVEGVNAGLMDTDTLITKWQPVGGGVESPENKVKRGS